MSPSDENAGLVPSEEEPEVLSGIPVGSGDPEGPLGGLDLGSLLEQAQQLQDQLMQAQQNAAATELEGRAGGGQVVVRISGDGEPLSVHIDPSVIDPDDAELLEDLVLAAMKDAVSQAQELGRDALGGLGGLFGGQPDAGPAGGGGPPPDSDERLREEP